MVRAPCCEKMGLKKGPWTPEEDQTLVAYIQKHGHGNWRALPKHAGLLRCGKSCRLRWTNYLRPDIKRGNFSKEEEETIINLHGLLGNRWSAIAAKLPGRTDNEIKNVWHTHLKKRLKKTENDNNNNININDGEEEDNSPSKQQQPPRVQKTDQNQPTIINNGTRQEESDPHRWYDEPITSPSSSSSLSAPTPTPTPHSSELEHPMRSSSSDFSTASAAVSEGSSRYEHEVKVKEEGDDRYVGSLENFPHIMEEYNSCLWFQAMPMESFLDTTVMSSEEFMSAATTATSMDEQQRKQQEQEEVVRHQFPVFAKEDNDFWRDLFREAGDLTELPGF